MIQRGQCSGMGKMTVVAVAWLLVLTILLPMARATTLVNLVPQEDIGIHVNFVDSFYEETADQTVFIYQVTTQSFGCEYEFREGRLVTTPERPLNPFQSTKRFHQHHNYPRSGIISLNATKTLRSPDLIDTFLKPQNKLKEVNGEDCKDEKFLGSQGIPRDGRCNGALAVIIGTCNLLSDAVLSESASGAAVRFSDFPFPAIYGMALLIDQSPGTSRTYSVTLRGNIPLQAVDSALFSHPLSFPQGRALLNAAVQRTQGPGCPFGCPPGYDLTTIGCVPICPGCVNGFCVRPGECECSPGFTGTDCTEALPQGPCPDGFFFDCRKICSGFHCSSKCSCLPSCSFPNVCGLNEVCISPDRCVCAEGFHRQIGENTTSSILQNPCVPTCDCCIHGTCIAPGACLCNDGWTGKNCDVRTTNICPIGKEFINGECVSQCDLCCVHGRCVGPNQCECDKGFTGPLCETPICDPVCLNFGICVAPNTCLCPTFLVGRQCEDFLSCPNCPQCNPNLPSPPPPPEPGCKFCPDPSQGSPSVVGPLCCGNTCFDPNTQRCTSERVICDLTDESCDGLCFDTTRYRCVNGRLYYKDGQTGKDKDETPTPPADISQPKSSSASRPSVSWNWLTVLCVTVTTILAIL